MKNYQLSIIVPHYNSSELLEKLLSTIPKDKNIEIIIIDDKSNTIHINYILNLQKVYNFIFLKNITSIKSAGTCRNIGLSYAKGKWIIFADADDYFTENFHDSVNKYFDYKDDIIFFIYTSIYLDTNKEAQRHIGGKNTLENYISDQSLENELKVRYQRFPPWSKMIKKEFILENNIKFDEVIASNDVMFSTKVGFYMKKFKISKNVLYVVTRNHGSLTVNMSENIFDARLKVAIRYYNFLKNNLPEEEFNIVSINLSRQLFSSFKYGISKFIKTFLLLKREKVKILDKRMLDIKFIFRKLFHIYKQNKQNKQYYLKR